MKLREFDLDAPDAPKSERLAFRSQSRAVTALYERCLGPMKVRRGWKVLIDCVPVVDRNEVQDLLGVLTFQVPFNIEDLSGLEKREKKRLILRVLFEGLTAVASAEGWPQEPFEHARVCVEDADFKNEWWWRKPKWNASKSLTGQLWCVHDLDAFCAWLVIKDRNGSEVARKLVIESEPDEFAFVPMLGDVKWTSPNRLALFAKDTSEVAAIEV